MTRQPLRQITSLREERLNQGKSLAVLAREIGVTVRVLQAAERGVVPRPANAFKIASYFDVAVTDLWPAEQEAA